MEFKLFFTTFFPRVTCGISEEKRVANFCAVHSYKIQIYVPKHLHVPLLCPYFISIIHDCSLISTTSYFCVASFIKSAIRYLKLLGGKQLLLQIASPPGSTISLHATIRQIFCKSDTTCTCKSLIVFLPSL